MKGCSGRRRTYRYIQHGIFKNIYTPVPIRFYGPYADILNSPYVKNTIEDFTTSCRMSEIILYSLSGLRASEVGEDQLISVEQKSKLWLELRKNSLGTGSSLGKYIPDHSKWAEYHTAAQIQAWNDKLGHTPEIFPLTALGHMAWGVSMEDVALSQFVHDHPNISAIQVGTIKLQYVHILQYAVKYAPAEWNALCAWLSKNTRESTDVKMLLKSQSLLVSPDGILTSKPYTSGRDGMDWKDNVIGALEIKAATAYENYTVGEHTMRLQMDPMAKRWMDISDAPFAYVTQIALQALSIHNYLRISGRGVDAAKMTMYFYRWHPMYALTTSYTFEKLFRFGILTSILYALMYSRIRRIYQSVANGGGLGGEDVNGFGQTEKIFDMAIDNEYRILMKGATTRFSQLYTYKLWMANIRIRRGYLYPIKKLDDKFEMDRYLKAYSKCHPSLLEMRADELLSQRDTDGERGYITTLDDNVCVL